MSSDGYTDQMGGPKQRLFGSKRLKALILDNYQKPFDIQKRIFKDAFEAYKGDNERQDDVTLLGFAVTKYQKVTILFASLRPAATPSDTQAGSAIPEEYSDLLKSYFEKAQFIIEQHGGFTSSAVDNSIIAFFPSNADNAVKAAKSLQKILDTLNTDQKQQHRELLAIGFGIHTCSHIFKSFEELKQMEQEKKRNIADDITIVAQLQSLTKTTGTSTLICDETLTSFADPSRFMYRFTGIIRLKKKNDDISVFEVFDTDPQDMREKKSKSLGDYDQGVFYYYNKDFSRAVKYFNAVLSVNPEDKVAQKYVARAEQFTSHSLPQDWEYLDSVDDA